MELPTLTRVTRTIADDVREVGTLVTEGGVTYVYGADPSVLRKADGVRAAGIRTEAFATASDVSMAGWR